MTDLKFCVVKTYNVPSISAFHRRKFFHSRTKSATESIDDWFRRIEESVSGCDFGNLSDFMLIDKFISCLNDETYEQFALQSPLNIHQCIGISTVMTFDSPTMSSLDKATNDPMYSLEEFTKIKLIKNEEEEGERVGRKEEKRQFSEDSMCEPIRVNHRETNNSKDYIYNTSEDVQRTYETRKETANTFYSLKPVKSKSKIIISNIKSTRRKNNEIAEDKEYERTEPEKVVCLNRENSFGNKSRMSKIHSCNICKAPFRTASKLKMHMRVHSYDGKSFECYLCSRKFRSLGHLKRHLRVYHMGGTTHVPINDFKCTQCEKTFSTFTGLNIHCKMHTNDSAINSYKCNGCDRKFGRRSIMLIHAIRHTNVRPFICETCGESFKAKKTLTNHMRKHSDERPFKCNICGKMMKWDTSLKHHMRSHAGERPFKCDLCEKTFAHPSNLRIHLRVHRDERPHICTMCNKRFVTLYNLNVHMLIHTGERPHKCNKCDKSFTQAATLRSHTNKWH